MANKRITDLTAAGALALTDLFEIDTGALSLKVTGQQIVNLIAAQNGQIFSGVGSPVGIVAPTSAAAVYFDTATGDEWKWYSAAWH